MHPTNQTRDRARSRRPAVLAALAFGSTSFTALGAQTPATQPHWSSYLGGAAHDLGAVVHRDAAGLVTIVGTTTSAGLGTAGAFQPAIAGDADAFVARLDPARPPGQQLLWYTYLGGSLMEIVFDAAVDAFGNVTVVGTSYSADFPTNNAYQAGRTGGSDGFVAQIGATGSALIHGTYLGGIGDDRVCSVALDAAGQIAVIGVTQSLGIATPGALNPSYLGGATDAFVARLDPYAAPAQQLSWLSYLGGAGQDGPPNIAVPSNGGLGVFWEGNLDKQFVAFTPAGDVVAVTVAGPPYAANATTPGCLQPAGAGLADVYLARLDGGGATLLYGTYFGGSDRDFPYAMALHPDGGVVIAGSSGSADLPTTSGCFQAANAFGVAGPSDAFACWIDEAHGVGAQQLRYATYFGGDGGEDLFNDVAVESSGLITLAGTGFGGGATRPYPTTVGSLRPLANPWDRCGAIVRLDPRGDGPADLVYSTLIGGAWTVLQGVCLDEVGDAVVVGTSMDFSYPVTPTAEQPTMTAPREVVVTHLPLLPGGTERFDKAAAVPACADRLYAAPLGAPVAGNLDFALSATNAPPSAPNAPALGACVLGLQPATNPPLPLVLVDPLDVVLVLADGVGFARCPLPVPPALPAGLVFQAQWLFLTNAACPGSGPLASSERLQVTTL